MCALVVAAAQAQDGAPFSLQQKGLRVGIVGTTFVGADAERMSPQASMSAGGFAVLALGRFSGGGLGLQLELLYTQRTTEQEIQLGGGSYTLRYDLAYLELPLLVRFATTVGGYVLAPSLGIAPGLRLGGKLQQSIPNSVPKAVDASFSPTDVGIVAGVGTEFALRRSARLLLDARVQVGTSTVLKEAIKPPLREEKPLRELRILALGLSAGIAF